MQVIAGGLRSREGGRKKFTRENWSSKRDYVLSMIGCAVGLGNIWRFPYLTYKNGGGAFLIPYFTMLLVTGIPLFFLESSFGQFCSQGPINIWRAAPLMQGVGIGMVMVTLLITIYYNVIMGYSLYYMFASMQNPLPWASCPNTTATTCSETPIVYCNNSGILTGVNQTCNLSNKIKIDIQSPSEYYWDHVALQRSSGLEETGPVVWHLALCLMLSTLLACASLIKGIKSSGKVVYFTATFPYVVILILLIRGVTLEGARDGIEFYIGSKSNLTKLSEAQVWKDAATQIFFSLSIGLGGLMALSSYNNFHNNVLTDTLVVSITNAATSIFAGFAIFSIMGHMAHIYKLPVTEVVKEGFGLTFIAYPGALTKLPISPLWSVLFFFMILTVGLDSLFAEIEVLITSVQDAYPQIFKPKRALLTTVTCAILFLLGLPCVTRAGIYWVTIIDSFIASWVVLFLVFLEVVSVSYIYGVNRFIEDIEMMIGQKSPRFWLWWKTCWLFVTPFILLVILVWSLFTFSPPTYGDIRFPSWGLSLGWCMLAFVLLWLPVAAVYHLTKAKGTLVNRLMSVCAPSEDWGPYLEINREGRYPKRQTVNIKNDSNDSDEETSGLWL
ncbi:sodium- and chloride-dependent neutral and basic amino acid transporter B(0+) [Poeciliopsis prolifica]|uniref:sodium- and chloride-dependent neutral and basic amino acid transporter B(0+) n=1 Tax=Poeciliopsis prolifica TaxID=188132 RepID=UPI002413006D|nr:sodium- and chloride-dependent neutral and basic amino acid transporter B(0+) [Poeciliopsis prolifica]XP_054883422.1 sodium- and chloride-dependent neutral and basic amino acid transporter B(0+) [Poeciliopsis prolifica]